jgi:hypothetical protein
LGVAPTIATVHHAHVLGGAVGEPRLPLWDDGGEGPRPAYDAMQDDGLVWQVLHGQMGLDVWADDDARPTRRHGVPRPRTCDDVCEV